MGKPNESQQGATKADMQSRDLKGRKKTMRKLRCGELMIKDMKG
jgi:hypothetical protein